MVTRSRGRDIDWDVEKAIAGYFNDALQAKEKNIAAYVGVRLRRAPEYADRTPSARTLQRVVQRLTLNVENWPEDVKLRDRAFAWDRLDEYDLPWEASSFLLSMWRYAQEMGRMLELRHHFSPLPPPTVRQAQWWWRVHQAVPEVENELDIYLWAEAFVQYELYKDILGKPVDMTGLWAYLAYKPWESAGALETYNIAWFGGHITHLPSGFEHVPLSEELRAIQGGSGHVPGGINALEPGKLPSEAFNEFLAKRKLQAEEHQARMQELTLELEQLRQSERGEKEE